MSESCERNCADSFSAVAAARQSVFEEAVVDVVREVEVDKGTGLDDATKLVEDELDAEEGQVDSDKESDLREL